MTQHDYDLANQNGASFRSDGNNLFEAIASLNSGATEPSVKFPNMSWMDDASLILKIRNSANTAWINVAQKNGSTWIPYRDGVLLGTAAILASTAVLQAANDLSDLADAATARTNLGLATVAQAEAEAGTATTARAWTAQRVKQAIAALASAGGGLKSRQIFTADGTWTRPAGITLIRLKMIGASGGGGGSTGGNDGGRGGHSRLAEALIDVSATASAAVTIGAGGAGGNRSRGGSAGGATSLGSLMDITGGGGGGGWGNNLNAGASGSTGVATGDDFNENMSNLSGGRFTSLVATCGIGGAGNTGVGSGTAGRPGVMIIEEYA